MPRGKTVELLPVRFMAKVGVGDNGCWDWLGATTTAGYGHLRKGGRDEPVIYAHRYSYELFNGPIPEGLQIDHLCRNRRCVNPEHLEAVTREENLARGDRPYQVRAMTTHCGRGHPRGENTLFRRATGAVVYCKACRREDRAAARALV